MSGFPGMGRDSLTGGHLGALRQAGSAGAGSCSRAEAGALWEPHRWPQPGHSFLCQQVSKTVCRPKTMLQNLCCNRNSSIASLCQAPQRVPWSRRAAGNTARAAFLSNVLSGHVSELHALGQTDCSCLTASCHTTATAERTWARPRRPSPG